MPLLGYVMLWGEPVTIGAAFFLLLALILALSFEFVNGFHDTANAVATVIYTHTLKPTYAVVWSGCWNLAGVLWSSARWPTALSPCCQWSWCYTPAREPVLP